CAALHSLFPRPTFFTAHGHGRSQACAIRVARRASTGEVLIARNARRRRARDRRTASRPSSFRPKAARSQGRASIPNGPRRRRATARSVPARVRSPAGNPEDETPSLHAVTEPLSEQAENAWLSCVVALCYCVHCMSSEHFGQLALAI